MQRRKLTTARTGTLPFLRADARAFRFKGDESLSDTQKGDSAGASENKDKPDSDRPAGKPGKQRASDVGRALRSVYDETLREEVPDDFAKLLGKLG
jgi:hypothetical protein